MSGLCVRLSSVAFFTAAFLELLLFCSPARAAGDPYLEWWTLETPHFRVHYYKGLEPAAEKIAGIAEGVNSRLEGALGWKMSEVTEIVLTDNTDDANGSAATIPMNTIRLYATAPDDTSPLGDYDDWYLELVTHELTHILHTDNVTGVPAFVNKLTGKIWTPNQMQPRWILEGLAVLEESEHTGGGRNRSSVFDMYLRADVLEGRMATLDQMSHSVRRWPQGNLWYLYGSRFLTWIADVYGEATFRTVAQDYGRQIMPGSINRSIRRATGQTYEQLYDGWKAYLGAHYRAQMAEVSARGLREGTRITEHGQIVAQPRFVPNAAKKTDSPYELVYFRDDGHSRQGLYRLALAGPGRADRAREELVVRTRGKSSAAFASDGRLVFGSTAVTRRVYAFNDLFALPPGVEDPGGFDPARKRLTEGERAQEPDVSPTGRELVFTENHRGTQTLMIADLSDDSAVTGARALVPSGRFEQAYTPRFSPDGKWVAYSAWTSGGYRDIRLVDVGTGQFSEITHDRALDWQPTFSPDGKTLFFASDRALGIPNVFAYDLAGKTLRQVTNVRTGALFPEISPDGKFLIYAGYGSFGYDLYALRLDPAQFTEAPPYVDVRPDPPGPAYGAITSRHRFSPLGTLRPRSWRFDYSPGNFGQALSLTTSAADVVGHHALSAALLIETQGGLQGALAYGYGRLPFDFGMSVARYVSPVFDASRQLRATQQSVAVASAISYSLPNEFEGNSFSLAYSLSRSEKTVVRRRDFDPEELVGNVTAYQLPAAGQVGAVYLGWGYSNAEGYLHSVGAERGFTLSLSASAASPALGGDYTIYSLSASATAYVPMPWAPHHTLALHAASAISAGQRRYTYYNGGFQEKPLFERFGLGTYQGPFVLRGYPPFAFGGPQFYLANAEYRFPIWNIDRGMSTFPFFVHRINGNVFADYGGAFDDLDPHDWTKQFHLGVGAELWVELTIAYFLSPYVRIGYARGVADDFAIPKGQTYIVFAAPF